MRSDVNYPLPSGDGQLTCRNYIYKTVVEEKEVTYEDTTEIMEHFEKKGYITS